jgi:hypothetical protein
VSLIGGRDVCIATICPMTVRVETLAGIGAMTGPDGPVEGGSGGAVPFPPRRRGPAGDLAREVLEMTGVWSHLSEVP